MRDESQVAPSRSEPGSIRPDATRASPSLASILVWVACGYLVIHTCAYMRFAWSMVKFPYDVDGAEGISLLRATLFAHGQGIYRDIHRPPYMVANYPPVFELVLALPVWLFGPSLAAGRALSIVAAILCALSIGAIVRTTSGMRLPGIVAGLLFLASGWVASWSVLCRIDLLALMWSLVGLHVFLRARAHDSRGEWAIPFFLLGLFTRQSAVSAPLAAIVATLTGRRTPENAPPRIAADPARRASSALDWARHLNWGPAIRLTTILGTGGLVTLAVLLWTTHGEFWRHVTTYTLSGFYWGQLAVWSAYFFRGHGLVAGAALLWLVVRRPTDEAGVLVGTFWVCALMVTLTVGKAGASINYFLEFWAACCLVVGVALAELIGTSDGTNTRKAARTGAVLILIAQLLILMEKEDLRGPDAADRAAGKRLTQYVIRTQGPLLSEYPGYLVQNGREVLFQQYALPQLSAMGLWDQRPFLEEIRSRRFNLILRTAQTDEWGQWTPEMTAAMAEGYRCIDVVRCYERHSVEHTTVDMLVLVPKSR